MRVRKRRRMQAGRDQTGDMRHVDHETGADRIGDPAEGGKVDLPGIGGAAGDDDPGLVLERKRLDLIDVDALIGLTQSVADRVEPFAGEVGRGAVRQMPAGIEPHPEDCVAGLGNSEQNGLVRLTAGMRLHIGKVATKQLAGPLDREQFHHIDMLAAAVIAAARIALRIFVRQHRTGRVQHRAAHDILGRDQLDFVALTLEFCGQRARHCRIDRFHRIGEEAGGSRLWRRNEFQVRLHKRAPAVWKFG